jgi:biotin carboxylase
VIVLPTTTYRAGAFLAAARALDVDVVVATDVPPALSAGAGVRTLVVPLDDPVAAAEAIVTLDRSTPVDAVIAVDDHGALTAAHAATRLGLVANRPDAVAATRDKAEMRRRLAAAEVAQPRFVVLDRPGGPTGDDVLDATEVLGYPVVVKPVGLAGSRGVIRADDDLEAVAAFERIRRLLTTIPEERRTLVVESFVDGAEVAVEGILEEGEFRPLAIFDKPEPLDGPYFEETYYVTPSRHPFGVQDAAVRVVGAAATALGLREGPVHGEVRIPPSGDAVLLEVAARTIGGRCAAAVRLADGVTLEEVVLRHALGMPRAEGARARDDVGSRREGAPPGEVVGASGVMMLPTAHTGTLVGVRGTAEALAVDGVVAVEITVPVGKRVSALPEGGRYLGFLFAEGESPEAVEAALRAGFAALEIAITPEIDPELDALDRAMVR